MPKPGAYRKPLAEGLKKLNQPELAELVEQGDVKLAIASSIYGPVTCRSDLTEPCTEALNQAGGADAEHYVQGLKDGRFVPVESYGVNAIYQDGRTHQTPGPEKDWAPGELFLKS